MCGWLQTARSGHSTDNVPVEARVYAHRAGQQLSIVEFKEPQGGVDKKGVVLYITVHLSGSTSDVETWAKRINTAAVLAQIGSGK